MSFSSFAFSTFWFPNVSWCSCVYIDALWVGDTLGIPTTYGQLVSSFIVLILRVCVRTM